MRMVQSTKFKVRYEINSRLSLTDPIYEVDKSNNILPSATAGCHYAEFLIYSSKSLSVKVQFTREDDNKGKRE